MATRINEKTYYRIVERQFFQRWGTEYDPAIRAVRGEAPTVSTASLLKCYRMRRQMHLLSRNEVRVAIVALHNPAVWYIREQQMLYWQDHPHFLHNHPESGVQAYLPMRGTWQIAESLGLRRFHPTVRVFSERHNSQVTVPFPFVGDLLLFLRDQQGSYAVNLTVKDQIEDFRRPFETLSRKSREQQAEKSIARHTIERLHYAAAGIRTEQVAGRLIPDQLFNNLRFLHGQYQQTQLLSDKQLIAGYELCQAGFDLERTPFEIGIKIDRGLGLRQGQGCAIVWRAAWERRIRVNLYTALLPDRRLEPEHTDPLKQYETWFSR